MGNEELLKEVEEMAGLFFTQEEVGIITGAKTESREFKTSYRRGCLKAEAEIRKIVLKQAKDGSGPAQTTAIKFIESLKRKTH